MCLCHSSIMHKQNFLSVYLKDFMYSARTLDLSENIFIYQNMVKLCIKRRLAYIIYLHFFFKFFTIFYREFCKTTYLKCHLFHLYIELLHGNFLSFLQSEKVYFFNTLHKTNTSQEISQKNIICIRIKCEWRIPYCC